MRRAPVDRQANGRAGVNFVQESLTKHISACVNIDDGKSDCGHLVDISLTVEQSIHVIMKGISLEDDAAGNVRVEPLVFSRLARGGKTTILRALFDTMKAANDVYPIIISFNGSSNFGMYRGQSPLEALLRTIAMQFVATPILSSNTVIRCEEQTLVNYLDGMSDKPIVLLIDELNNLELPLGTPTSAFLKKNFLSKGNRYLVFSTHELMGIEPVRQQLSKRGIRTVHMPLSFDMEQLTAMFAGIELSGPILTIREVTYCGGIPSLIYSTLVPHGKSPYARFSEFIKPLINDEDVFLRIFISVLLTGNIAENETLRKFNGFSSLQADSEPSTYKQWWPLHYISCMLELVPNYGYLSRILPRQLCSHNWLEWEAIVHLAIAMRCLNAHFSGCTVPFHDSFDVNYEKPALVHIRWIPESYQNLTQVHDYICTNTIAKFKTPACVYWIPQYPSFELVDGLLCYFNGVQWKFYGIQIKVGKATPATAAAPPDWVDHVYLVRGEAATQTYTL